MKDGKYTITVRLGDSSYTYQMQNGDYISGNLLSGSSMRQTYTITPYGVTPKTALEAYDILDAQFDKLEDQTSVAKHLLSKLGIKCD